MTREDKRSSFKSHNARLFPDTKMLTSECCRHTVKCRYCRKRVSEKVSSPYLPGSKSHSPKEQRCNSEPAGQTLHQLHQLARRPGGPPEDHPATTRRMICRIHNLDLTFFFFFISFFRYPCTRQGSSSAFTVIMSGLFSVCIISPASSAQRILPV